MSLSIPVQRALRELRDEIDDLSHVTSREYALSMFMFLFDQGEYPSFTEIQTWALEHEFSEEDARDLANMPDDIRYLVGRLASGIGWGRPDAWFAEV